MTKKEHPEWNEIVAFARELHDHGKVRIMLEIVLAEMDSMQ